MPSRAQQLLTGERVPIPEGERRISTGRIKRNTGRSGDETLDEESERFHQYIPKKYTEIIFDKHTAKLAYEKMKEDENLANLFDNVRKKTENEFLNELVATYGPENEDVKELSDSIRKDWGARPSMINPYTRKTVTKKELKKLAKGKYWGAAWFR